jgi:hypothetical protein
MVMFVGYLGFFSGMFIMWIWLTQASPYARKENKKAGVDVLCSHCGRMYRTSYGNVRTANYCNECK